MTGDGEEMAVVLSAPEQRVLLNGVSWETYSRLLEEHGRSPGTRFHFDQGSLEIMVLSFGHESLSRLLALLVEELAIEMGIDVEEAGSTTFRREDLGKGFEPDASFYFRHAATMRGRRHIDLNEDPPPELVIEIDITSPSLDKLQIYSAVGVPEVWRYSNAGIVILKLGGQGYAERPESALLPGLTVEALNEFIRSGQKLKRRDWIRKVREWVRSRQ